MVTSTEFAGTGIDGLDNVLRGGYPRGLIYLIQAVSGAGKTTMALQFLMEGAQNGEKCLYMGNSESEPEIRRIAESHGWSLDGVMLRSPMSAIGDDQTMVHPAEVELPEFMDTMLEIMDEFSPDRVVVDSLAEIRLLAQNEMWYRRQLVRLKNHFADEKTTVLLTEVPEIHESLNSVVSGAIELDQQGRGYGPDRRRLRVLKIRGLEFATGYHDYRIQTGGILVYPRLVAAEHRRKTAPERVMTGLTEMDTMLGGGLIRGTGTLLLGPSGVGKSLLAAQLASAAAERGEKCAMYVFDERVQTVFDRANGVDLELERYVDEGLLLLRQVDPAELTPGEFGYIVKHLVERDGVQMLIIDSLDGYAFAMPEERYLSVHLHELLSYLNQQGVTSIFSMTQHGISNVSSNHTFDLSYIPDVVVLMRHFEFAGEVHKAMTVYKNRASTHETAIRELKINSKGLSVGEQLRHFRGVLTGTPEYLGEHLPDVNPSSAPSEER